MDRTIPPQRTPRLRWFCKSVITGAESLAGTGSLQKSYVVNPPVIQDEFFGALRWNDLVDWYESKIQIPEGREIRVSIKVGHDGPRAAVEQARRDFPSVLANEASYRKQVAAALLGTHNDHWNEGEKIDIERFMARMTLESIVFYVIYTELWYDDGDLFWGHSIYASLDSELRLTNATFEG